MGPVCQRFTGAVFLLLVGGCGGGQPEPTTSLVYDSAGVTVVDNLDQAWKGKAEWFLVEPPELEIGEFDADVAAQFFHLRDARFLGPDRIVVADGGTHELRFFDVREGRYQFSAGGEGEGPGEFESLSWRNERRAVTISLALAGCMEWA